MTNNTTLYPEKKRYLNFTLYEQKIVAVKIRNNEINNDYDDDNGRKNDDIWQYLKLSNMQLFFTSFCSLYFQQQNLSK